MFTFPFLCELIPNLEDSFAFPSDAEFIEKLLPELNENPFLELHLTGASIEFAQDVIQYEKVNFKNILQQNPLKTNSRNSVGCVVQCCIFDAEQNKQKKFTICVLNDDLKDTSYMKSFQRQQSLNLIFSLDQISKIAFRLKSRPYFMDTTTTVKRVVLSGSFKSTNDTLQIRSFLQRNCFTTKQIQWKQNIQQVLKKEQELKQKQQEEEEEKEATTTEETSNVFLKKGVIIKEILSGHGRRAKRGDRVTIHYKGKLDVTKRKCFDKTKLRHPLSFVIGSRHVIQGVQIGVEGMTLHSRRELIIPPNRAFGKKGFTDKVPADATVYYDIELIALKPKDQLKKEDITKTTKKALVEE